MPVVILLADGVRPDMMGAAMDAGAVPSLAALRDEGGLFTLTTTFPSVTGPAYTPFLMGRFPGPIGLPGLRWFDRERSICTFPDYTRSYVGVQMNRMNGDIDPATSTIFDLCEKSLVSLSPISRGASKESRLGTLSARSMWRVGRTHFSGNVAGWLDVDREVAAQVV